MMDAWRGRAHPAAWEMISDRSGDDRAWMRRRSGIAKGTKRWEGIFLYRARRRTTATTTDARSTGVVDAGRRVDLSAPLIRPFFETCRHVSNCVCMGKLYACVDGLFLSVQGNFSKKPKGRPARARFCLKREDEDDDDEDDEGERWKTDE